MTRSGAIALGVPISLASGSYEMRAAASGYDSARVTREVLPGVTTMVELRLRSAVAQVSPPRPAGGAGPQPQSTLIPKKKGFPVLLTALGATGGGVVAYLLLHKKTPPPTTGGITFTFPNP